MPLQLWVFFIVFGLWAGYAMQRKWSGLIGIGGGLALALVAMFPTNYLMTQYENRHPDSIESAHQFLVGTWVYAEPLTDSNPGLLSWTRWEIRPDGTLIQQTASPRDNRWGDKETLSYKVISDKFSDTGERFYGLRVADSAMSAAIMEDGRLLVQILGSQYHGYFERGDKDLNN